MLPEKSIKPSTAANSVLLPAPFGPTSRCSEAGATTSEMPASRLRRSRCTVSSRISRTGGLGMTSAARIGHQRLHHRVDVLLHLHLELVGRVGARRDVADDVDPRAALV